MPVIGVGGSMIGHISARHVYYILTSPSHLRLLKTPANRFLALIENKSKTFDIKSTAITVKPADSVGHVMQKMDKAHIHRVYVEDAHGHLIRTVSLCDILEKFIKNPDESCCLL